MTLSDVWCKLCQLKSVVMLLCGGLASLATKFSTISENNVTIKTKIEALVGDPDAECPDCPPPGEQVVAEQQVTQALVEQTVATIAQTTAIKEIATALKSKFSAIEARTAEKTADAVERTADGTIATEGRG